MFISFGCLPTVKFHFFWDRFTRAISDPFVYRFFLCTSFWCLPSVKFHFFWDRFTRAMSDPPNYWCTNTFLVCLPSVKFHIFRYLFTPAILNPPMYRFIMFVSYSCLPTFELKFVRDKFTFTIYNKHTYFKFVAINSIDYRTHLSLSLKKINR